MNVERPDNSEQADSGVDNVALIDAARREAEAAGPAPADRPTQASPGAGGTPAFSPDSFAGYQILKELHRGGQGVVYQAIQKSTKRKVALKVMREGPFATAAEEARFEREVQILGQLNHPNIVAIHDSGQAAGCHYFVMDYISGQPLDVWMASGERSVEETLRLFAKICNAVNAAHLRGITHRDLKPSNIRVDDNGEPHILDFGLAKVAHSPEEASLMTLTGQFVGSLPWASPEQAEGVPSKIDLRTDVYSLGVILHQMLTGRFPYEVIGNMRDVLDRIMKAEPERPSTIRKRINDEVETIVLKCLAKERERRYQSAGELARDIGHYLAGEPIEAKRDSAAYVLRKYLRKYRLPVGVAAGFAVVVTVGLVGSLTFWRQAVVARGQAEERRVTAEASEAKAVAEADEAKKQRDKAERIADFMAQTLSGVGPRVALGRDTQMLGEMMDAAAKRIEDGELQATPEAELRLRLTIGMVYWELAVFDSAERMLRPALDLARVLHPGDHPEVVESLNSLASLLQERGDLKLAEPLFREALEMCHHLYPGDHPRAAQGLNDLAGLLLASGDYAAAEPLFREALEMGRRLYPGGHPNVVAGLNNLAVLLDRRGDLAAAEPLFRESLEMQRRLFPGDHPQLAAALHNLAALLADADPTASEPLYREALETRRRLFAGDHPDVAGTLLNLASLLADRGDLAEAEPLYREAAEMYRRLFPDDHPLVANSLTHLAGLLVDRGDLAQAESLFREALEMYRRIFPADHPDLAGGLYNLGTLLQRRGDLAAAESLQREALDMRRRIFGRDHPDVASSLYDLAMLLDERGDAAAAEPFFREAVEVFRKVRPGGDWLIGNAIDGLGHCLADLKRFDDAEAALLDANAILQVAPGVPPDRLRGNIIHLIDLYDAWDAAEPGRGHDQQAAEWRAKLAEWQASTQPATQPAAQPATAALG
jgi:tetratricopeptide (TPR) repeat protein/tRNA A-37 threonylcarbamoyl transferase component Bud32